MNYGTISLKTSVAFVYVHKSHGRKSFSGPQKGCESLGVSFTKVLKMTVVFVKVFQSLLVVQFRTSMKRQFRDGVC